MNRAYQKNQYGPEYNFKPKVSDKNHQIYLKRLGETGSSNVKIEDRLIDTKRQNVLLKHELKQEHDQQLNQQMPFQPGIGCSKDCKKNEHLER